MGKRCSLSRILIQTGDQMSSRLVKFALLSKCLEALDETPRDLGNLERVRQPAVECVSALRSGNLRNAAEPQERR